MQCIQGITGTYAIILRSLRAYEFRPCLIFVSKLFIRRNLFKGSSGIIITLVGYAEWHTKIKKNALTK
jgi:hypothetical protein